MRVAFNLKRHRAPGWTSQHKSLSNRALTCLRQWKADDLILPVATQPFDKIKRDISGRLCCNDTRLRKEHSANHNCYCHPLAVMPDPVFFCKQVSAIARSAAPLWQAYFVIVNLLIVNLLIAGLVIAYSSFAKGPHTPDIAVTLEGESYINVKRNLPTQPSCLTIEISGIGEDRASEHRTCLRCL